MLVSGILGFLTFRKIVHPIQGLQRSVQAIAAGDYLHTVPFTSATDETGALARSIDVLKTGAAAMEEQRWVKSNIAKLAGAIQGAASIDEFGERLLSGLVPVLGGGVAGFYVMENGHQQLRRVAGYGLTEGAGGIDSFRVGEGLVGQCAFVRVSTALTHLPPDYLRITSGVGGAAPVHASAWPLISHDNVLGVIEFASFHEFSANQKALMRGVAARSRDEPGDPLAQHRHAEIAGADAGAGTPVGRTKRGRQGARTATTPCTPKSARRSCSRRISAA